MGSISCCGLQWVAFLATLWWRQVSRCFCHGSSGGRVDEVTKAYQRFIEAQLQLAAYILEYVQVLRSKSNAKCRVDDKALLAAAEHYEGETEKYKRAIEKAALWPDNGGVN